MIAPLHGGKPAQLAQIMNGLHPARPGGQHHHAVGHADAFGYIMRHQQRRFALAADDIVDDLFDRVKLNIIEELRTGTSDGEQATDLLMVAKYFERIGDHATNIAGWVIFSLTGEHE